MKTAPDAPEAAAEAMSAVTLQGFAALDFEPFLQLQHGPSLEELVWFFDELALKLDSIDSLDVNDYLINVVGP